MEHTHQDLPIDHGWAWVVLAAATAAYSMLPFQAAGVLLVEILDRYNGIYDPSALLWVVTLVSIIYGVIGPLAGILIEKFGHRSVLSLGILLLTASYVGLAFTTKIVTIILLFSFPMGIGTGMVFLASLSVCNQYFDKRRALALSVVCGGTTLSCLIHPHIYRVFFDNLSFTEACLMYGGFNLQFLIPVCLIRPMSYYEQRLNNRRCQSKLSVSTSSADNTETMNTGSISSETKTISEDTSTSTVSHHSATSKSAIQYFGSAHFAQFAADVIHSPSHKQPIKVEEEKFHWRVILLPKYLILGISMFIFSFGLAVAYVSLPALGQEAGIPKSTVAIALTASGSLQMPSRIFCGVLVDKNIVTSTNQYAFILILAGILLLLCAVFSGLLGLVLGLIGLYCAGSSIYGVVPAAARELIGTKYVTSAMSVNMVFEFIGFLASSYITGAIYDMSGSWRVVVYYVSAVMLVSGCIMLPYCLYRYRCRLGTDLCHNNRESEQT